MYRYKIRATEIATGKLQCDQHAETMADALIIAETFRAKNGNKQHFTVTVYDTANTDYAAPNVQRWPQTVVF